MIDKAVTGTQTSNINTSQAEYSATFVMGDKSALVQTAPASKPRTPTGVHAAIIKFLSKTPLFSRNVTIQGKTINILEAENNQLEGTPRPVQKALEYWGKTEKRPWKTKIETAAKAVTEAKEAITPNSKNIKNIKNLRKLNQALKDLNKAESQAQKVFRNDANTLIEKRIDFQLKSIKDLQKHIRLLKGFIPGNVNEGDMKAIKSCKKAINTHKNAIATLKEKRKKYNNPNNFETLLELKLNNKLEEKLDKIQENSLIPL